MKKRDCSWLWFIISLAIMLIFRLLPVPSGLTASGMQVLGILVGAIILWLTLGTTWTSAFVLFALCTVAVLEPVVIVCAIVYFLIGRLLWKPDVTPLANLDYDRLAASVGPMTKKAKWSAWVYAMVVIMWVLPGVCKYVAPGAYVYLSKIDQTYPPIIALVLMTLVKVDGEKALDFKDAMANASWGVFLFIASVMAMGSAMANSEIGISAWLAAEMGPLFSNISPEMFIAIAVVFLVVLTNFTSNSVVVALGFTIFMPLCTTVYADSISAAFMGLMKINASQHSWATPPATPASAIAAGSGWLDTGNMFRWGMVVAAFSCVILLTLGQLLGKVFC